MRREGALFGASHDHRRTHDFLKYDCKVHLFSYAARQDHQTQDRLTSVAVRHIRQEWWHTAALDKGRCSRSCFVHDIQPAVERRAEESLEC